jgi:hypothetical protein
MPKHEGWSRVALGIQLGAATVLMGLVVAALAAHDLFLKLDTYFVPPDTTIRVAVLNGTFMSSEGPVARDRLTDLSLTGTAGRAALPREAWTPAGDTTWLTLRTGAAGTYMVGASTLPRELALAAADFNAYLEHDGIPDVLEERRRRGELDRAVRERYHKHVKAILQVGLRRTDAYRTPFGYPAELVPLANPYQLGAGDTLALRCLVDGIPAANQLVIAGGERAGRALPEIRSRSDADGVVRVALGSPGRWFVKFVHMERSARPGVDYESKWATLTFEVR